MINLILTIILVLFFVLPLNKKYGIQLACCIYILMIYLIPSYTIPLLGNVQLNRVFLSFYLLFILLIRTKCINWGSSRYIFIYYLSLLLVIIVSLDEIPFSFQFKPYIRSLIADGILLYVLYNVSLRYANMHKYVLWSMVILILVTCIYGFFNASFLGINPYVNSFPLDTEQNEVEIEMGDAGRIFGRVTSVYMSPWYCGNFLTMAGIYFLFLHKEIGDSFWRKYGYWILFVLFWIFVFISGNRSALAVLCVVYLIYLWNKIPLWKTLGIILGVVALFAFVVIPNVPILETYIDSIIHSDSSDSVTGSTAGGRIEQFIGCFDEWLNNPIFGHGYNWTSYYRFQHGGAQHPTMLGFESILIIQLCNLGLYGCFMTYYLFHSLYKSVNRAKDVIYLIFGFLLYSSITGIYGSFESFIVFFVASALLLNSNRKVFINSK